MTRECNWCQFDLFDVKKNYAACLLGKEQFVKGGFHMLYAKESPKLDTAETDEEGLSIASSKERSRRAKEES